MIYLLKLITFIIMLEVQKKNNIYIIFKLTF